MHGLLNKVILIETVYVILLIKFYKELNVVIIIDDPLAGGIIRAQKARLIKRVQRQVQDKAEDEHQNDHGGGLLHTAGYFFQTLRHIGPPPLILCKSIIQQSTLFVNVFFRFL